MVVGTRDKERSYRRRHKSRTKRRNHIPMRGGRRKPRRNDLYKESSEHRTYLDHNPDQHDKDNNQIQIKKPLKKWFFQLQAFFQSTPKILYDQLQQIFYYNFHLLVVYLK